MPGQFTDKNGGNMAGHSDKWSDKNRRPNSYQAGQGSRGSRNQGTGAAGKANTVATDTVDTSKMSKEEKLKYFNSLGLLSPAQKKEMEPKAEPVKTQPAPSTNPVKELSDKLGKIFSSKPQLIQGIVKALQSVPKEQLKDKAQAVLRSMEGNSSTEPTEVFKTIMQALEGPGEAPEAKPAPRDRTARMTEEEFRSTNEYLGDKFVQSMIDQANQFTEPEKALFMIDMAIENVDDVNDVRAVRNSMASAADDLAANGFELKNSGSTEEESSDEPEVGSPEWVRMITNKAFETNGTQPITSYNSYHDLIKNKKDHNLFMNYMDMTERNPKTKVLYDLAMQKLNDFDAEEGEESKFINIGDAFFSILKDGIDVEQSSGTGSTEEAKPQKELSPGMKHFVDLNKDALDEPTVEQGLEKFRNKGHQEELKEFLQWIADEMKKEGAKPASINKNINHYYNELKDNYFKFRDARNAMSNNAEAYDPEYGSEIEHHLMSMESAIESFDRQGMSDDERNFVRIYNYINDK